MWHSRLTQQLCDRAEDAIQTSHHSLSSSSHNIIPLDLLRDNLHSSSCSKYSLKTASLTYIHHPFFSLLSSFCHSLLGLLCSSYHTFFSNGETFLKDIHSCCLIEYYLDYLSEEQQQKAPRDWDCSLTLSEYSVSLPVSAFALTPLLDEVSVANLASFAVSY